MKATFDADGYPTEAALRKLARWPAKDINGALDFARALWHWPAYARKRGRRYTFITGGWSGNESVIAALEKNTILFALCWVMSKRGGLHVYEAVGVKK